MNEREKLLGAIVGGLVLVGVLGLGIRAVVYKPLQDLDKRAISLRNRISKVQDERRSFFSAEDRIKSYTLRTFADSVDEASAASGEMLTRQILQSGLKEADFTRLPAGPRKLRGATEMGWSVQGQGSLSNVVNLVFGLQQSPWVHQVDGLAVNPGDAPGIVKVRFRYLTLVMDPAPEVVRKPLAPKVALDSPQRHLFDMVTTRDIMRPYVKRSPVAAAQSGSGKGSGVAAVPPGPESFRVVSLSEWQGQPEVHVRDLIHNKTARYKAGDELAGGKIVMIDYRPMPMPGHTPVQSFSRVILKIENEFYAVERGANLSEKHKLRREDLPVELARAQ